MASLKMALRSGLSDGIRRLLLYTSVPRLRRKRLTPCPDFDESRNRRSVVRPQRIKQPGARIRPMAFRGARRDSQRGGRLVEGQTSEKPQLHDAGTLGIIELQAIESLIDRQQVFVRGIDRQLDL